MGCNPCSPGPMCCTAVCPPTVPCGPGGVTFCCNSPPAARPCPANPCINIYSCTTQIL
ncbi:hypothetical protein JYU34_003836 [Plutella xylostella]|uniref:Uncharacterized protein n=1 Tax=Plutella xylostella TaxID=51655 RepID=A0ABQ7R121_PLUXY|nr:hypothetical protein JYU34_003836 [Plutella xylostella]